MRNLIIFTGILCILILVGGAFLNEVRKEKTATNTVQTPPTNYEYFWSETCPHCANVAKFMESWDKKDQIAIEKFEVNKSASTRNKFLARGKFCNIIQSDLGVPLLVTPEGECLVGDEPIIQFFRELE